MRKESNLPTQLGNCSVSCFVHNTDRPLMRVEKKRKKYKFIFRLFIWRAKKREMKKNVNLLRNVWGEGKIPWKKELEKCLNCVSLSLAQEKETLKAAKIVNREIFAPIFSLLCFLANEFSFVKVKRIPTKQAKCLRVISPWLVSTKPQTKRPSSGKHTSDPWRVRFSKFCSNFFFLLNFNILCWIGSEDIRANEGREDFRTPFTIYDEPSTAAGRITVPGYRYLPVSRETYGYSPRAIYSRPSQRPRMFLQF